MIADNNKIFCEKLNRFFTPDTGITIIETLHNGPDTLKAVKEKKPDILILDLILSQLDGLEVLRQLNQMKLHPRVIISTAVGQDSMIREAVRLGIDYFILKPYDISALSTQIRRMAGSDKAAPPPIPIPRNYDAEVTSILHRLGVPAHVKGYQYLRSAILLVLENRELLNAVTKELYPRVAELCNTTACRVERAIRHAIILTWDRSNSELMEEYFGSSMRSKRHKPTNSEFIAIIAEHLRINNPPA